jgi:antitoxin MazE
MKTELAEWGNSLAVRIPKHVAESAKIRKGDVLELSLSRRRVIRIRAARSRPSLAQLLRRITAHNLHTEIDWGKPVGKELW